MGWSQWIIPFFGDFIGTLDALRKILTNRCAVPIFGSRILRQAQNKFEPRLKGGGILLTLNLQTLPNGFEEQVSENSKTS
jgi:hypothetical protein